MDNGASSYRRFTEGDESGFVEIVRDYKDGLILYLNSFVRDVRIAEELAEDTFVKLGIKKPKNFEKASFKTWLYTIGRNTAIDYIRHTARKRIISLDDLPDAADDAYSLEESYIHEENKRQLHHAIGELKSEYRQVLTLIYFEDMTCKEAAKIMKKSTHNIEALVSRARKALKVKLEEQNKDAVSSEWRTT
ncbi:MAG: RNA polymerase sigma factor [Clostridiales bacterium]|nr:RNA polymerase sigma factor [Clostridiales bacterium]